MGIVKMCVASLGNICQIFNFNFYENSSDLNLNRFLMKNVYPPRPYRITNFSIYFCKLLSKCHR